MKVETRFAFEHEDEARREENFAENDERIEKFNKRENKTYEQGHNEYSDESFTESRKLRTGLKISKSKEASIKSRVARSPQNQKPNLTTTSKPKLPASVNYTKSFGPVKDQSSKKMEYFVNFSHFN
jgi:hypothetical protein